MTCREKLAIEHPDEVHDSYEGGCRGCPNYYGYLEKPVECRFGGSISCTECWDREIPEEPSYEHKGEPIGYVAHTQEENGGLTFTVKPCTDDVAFGRIKDSGNRREFDSGAVRDMAEGKGRCDLMPLDVITDYFTDLEGKIIPLNYSNRAKVFERCELFQKSGDVTYLYDTLNYCCLYTDPYTMLLEVAKHFEEGCKKYGENNWRKGIPVKFYIDSAVRHYLKYLRGDKDEPHDRAFCWNILCAIWTHNHKPELRINPPTEEPKTE